MKNIRICLLIFLSLFPASGLLFAQRGMTLPQYIETYRTVAMQEMRRNGIPASIKLAQGILESGFGNSELAVRANNHFGIKCHGWPGRGYRYDDDAPRECFRLYDNPIQSYLDHSDFLLSRERYDFLFDLNPMDYRAWAHGLRRAGYATNPNYPAKLIRIIEEHDLTRFDRWAMDLAAELPPGPSGIRADSVATGMAVRPGEMETSASGPRHIARNNRIKYVVARRGDTPASLAEELPIRRWQVIKYNELADDQEILPGQFIYLQPKRRRGTTGHHIVRERETMYIISQQYGIKLDQLYRRNAMEPGEEPVHGQRLLLRGRIR